MSNTRRNKCSTWNKLFTYMRKRNGGKLDLSYANLSNANLSSADLWDANLSNTKGVCAVWGVGRVGRFALFWVKEKQLQIIAGCFNGTDSELLEKSASQYSKDSQHYKGYEAAIRYAKIILSDYLEA